MKKLMRYFKGYVPMVVLAPTFKLIEAVFELLTPLLVADIIDIGIAGGNLHYILTRGGYMILLGVLGFGFSMACQYLASRAGSGFAAAIRSAMLRNVDSLSYADLDGVTSSSLSTRITNDVNQLQQGASMAMRLLTRSPFLIVGATVGAALISPMISLVFLGVAILIAAGLYFIMARTSPYYRRSAKQLDRVAALAKESLTGARVIRAYAKQEFENEKAKRETEELARISLRANRISALLNPFSLLIVNLGIIAIVYWGGFLAADGALTAGKITALVNYMTQIQLSLVVIANLIVIFTRTGAAARRVNEVLALKNTLPTAEERVEPDRTAPVLELKDVRFAYCKDAENSLDGITAAVRAGESFGIIGGTGSGKSTLVHLLLHFYEPTEGSIRLFGRDVRDYPASQLRELVGFVPQRPVLFSGTIRSNLTWRKRDATDEELWHALELAQAKEFVERYEDGLDHEVAQNGRNFSGGQRQRLTIARALVGDPEIVILDDSSSALDAATDARLRAAIRRTGATTILISQRTGSLSRCNSILVLDQGNQAGLGTHRELLADCPLYEEIAQSQSRETGGTR